MPKYVKSFLSFVKHERPPRQMTDQWTVKNQTGLMLGEISWHAPWRRYVFHTRMDSVFDLQCLLEISHFLDVEMKAYKLDLARRTGRGSLKAIMDIYGQPEST